MKIFVKLPVNGLPTAAAFFTQPRFDFGALTDETDACMVLRGRAPPMPLMRARFQVFHPKAVCDATPGDAMLAALRSKSRGQVDELLRRAVAAASTTRNDPRTAASCTATASRTWTATAGSWST